MEFSSLLDQTQIRDLLSRYCAAVDDKHIDAAIAAATFTAEGRYVAPNGAAISGPEAISNAQAKVFARFSGTHHLTTDHIVDMDGDTARLRANMTAMHVWPSEESDPKSPEMHFLAGGVFEAVAVRTSHGWRFSELACRITWRSGDAIAFLSKFQRQAED